ncbi:MAG TPA: class I adenylate-forming enzyme family protein [Amycolatopsis sp.]|uniref:class I adenylate-forming enzyme family protein n=1 Tax=Amycolatopsis sp. TaxID=37632 RepID=UPI002B478E2C|nr:class I adenylate-forming enzyme family protein [Amycolatopsis sp.]HKS46152.1 class I adenylate-forming enzyme family protein [Amycolatopsis sp.]
MATRMSNLVDELFAAHPGELAYLIHEDHVVSRAEIEAAVAREVAVFAGFGIGAGSTAMLQVPPSRTQFEAMLALWRLGAQVMLVDHRLKAAEVAALRVLCRPQVLIRAGGTEGSLGFRLGYELITSPCHDGLASADVTGAGHALVQFSSGSTGMPKVIGRTAASLAAEIDRFTRIEGMPVRGERVLLLSSTAHSFGLIAGLLHSLATGVSVVFARRVSARDMLAAAARHRVHAVFGTPFHYELLSTARDLPALPDLRAAVSGGEIMPLETAARFAERFGLAVGESYGTTESGVIAMDVSGASRPAVGPPAPGMRVRIRDAELDVELPDGSPYLHSPGDGRYVDGWLRTRDRAELDETGAVRLLGRADSLVVIGGLKLDLAEVETVLRGHPMVGEAVVVHSEVTEAYVCAEAGDVRSEDLLRWCRERLADYKVPRVIHVLSALPRTSNGKLVRHRDALLALSPNP